MHLGAFLGVFQDRGEKAEHLKQVLDPQVGFEEQPCGAWTWQVQQLPLEQNVGAVRARMLDALAKLLRWCPDARCNTASRQHGGCGASDWHPVCPLALRHPGRAVRRRYGTAGGPQRRVVRARHRGARGGAHAADQINQLMGLDAHDGRHSPKIPRDSDLEDAKVNVQHQGTAPVVQRHRAVRIQPTQLALGEHCENDGVLPIQRVTATALMFAVISVRCLVPEFELAQRQEDTAAYFTNAGLDADGRFYDLLMKMKCMLASDNIRKSGQWLDRARLWRIILLAHNDGFWAPSQGLAFSLLAVHAKPADISAAQSCFRRGLALVGVLARTAASCFFGAQQAEERGGHLDHERGEADEDLDDMEERDKNRTEDMDPEEEAAVRSDRGPPDCPLTYSMLAILRSTPKLLGRTQLTKQHQRRIWATALTVATLDKLDVSWATSGMGYFGQGAVGEGTHPETLLDRGEAWLAAQPLPAEQLRRVKAAAAACVSDWRLVQDQRISAMRAAELKTLAHGVTLLQRVAGEIVSALMETHDTLGVFLAPYLDASACHNPGRATVLNSCRSRIHAHRGTALHTD
jgi:hypothetical protein